MKISIIIPTYNRLEMLKRCLDSIEQREDVETIIINDCSTDGTKEFLNSLKMKNLKVINNRANLGTGLTINKGYDRAIGEYLITLCDDDYFIKLGDIISKLKGKDLVYYNLETNDGSIFKLSPKTKLKYCGGTKLIRREFLGDLRRSKIRIHGDRELYLKLLEKKPTEKFTNITLIHYDYPREDTLTTYALNNNIKAVK